MVGFTPKSMCPFQPDRLSGAYGQKAGTDPVRTTGNLSGRSPDTPFEIDKGSGAAVLSGNNWT